MNRRNFLTPLGLLLIAAFPQWTRSRITPSSRMWLHESSSDLQRVWKLRGGLCRGICSQMSPALLGGTEGHGWGRGGMAPGAWPVLFCLDDFSWAKVGTIQHPLCSHGVYPLCSEVVVLREITLPKTLLLIGWGVALTPLSPTLMPSRSAKLFQGHSKVKSI